MQLRIDDDENDEDVDNDDHFDDDDDDDDDGDDVQVIGKVGQVINIDRDGDLLVTFGRQHFLFDPSCCTHVTSDTRVDSLPLHPQQPIRGTVTKAITESPAENKSDVVGRYSEEKKNYEDG